MNAAAQEPVPFAHILNVTEEQYHADPCAVISLNQSVAHEIVAECPLKGWQAHPRLGKQQLDAEEAEKDTKATLAGKVIHRLILGKGAEIDLLDFPDFRTNRAKDARDESKAAGRLPVLRHHMDDFAGAADILREKISLLGYTFDGESEVAIEWNEDGARGPVRCRGRMDHLRRAMRQVIDVKKIVSAHPTTISRHIYDYGYDVQWAAYTSGVSKLLGCTADDISYILLFMEIEPPYVVTPVDMRLCHAYREIGRMRWDRAVMLWEQCLHTNRWPEYANSAIGVEPMPYVMTQELGNSGNW